MSDHDGPAPPVRFRVDGREVQVPAEGTLLEALREHVGVRSAKDGCSPQGQCGCCTVWVDGSPRVACVTPVTRVADRDVTTADAVPDADVWQAAFAAAGASQCGFCTPGIIARVAALPSAQRSSPAAVRRALLAHLCRCTGWGPIVDAVIAAHEALSAGGTVAAPVVTERSRVRARLEGGVPQDLGPDVAAGRGGFADDTAPPEAAVAVRRGDASSTSFAEPDTWVVADTLAAARANSGKVQGRRTTAPVAWPLELPDGDWDRTLRTTWVEPAYLEPDASWCAPGEDPASPLGNGGAFGGKHDSPVPHVARALADAHGRPVRVLATREDVVRSGPKRPPVAAGLRADGTGVVRVVRTPGVADAIRSVAPGLEVQEVDVPGPPTSSALRAAGWAEAAVLLASLEDGSSPDRVVSPAGAQATARIDDQGVVHVTVRCGVDPDDPAEVTVARSYATGAAHMALGWVRSEALAVDDEGRPHDLTIRSFGVLRAVDTPDVVVTFEGGPDNDPVNGSDAVFAAVAAAAWRRADFAPAWPLAALPSAP